MKAHNGDYPGVIKAVDLAQQHPNTTFDADFARNTSMYNAIYKEIFKVGDFVQLIDQNLKQRLITLSYLSTIYMSSIIESQCTSLTTDHDRIKMEL